MIEDFLINAELCGLSLGQTKTEVLSKLGAPEDHSDKKGKTEIWRYGGLEISFDQELLSFIGLYFDDGSVPLPMTLSGTKVIEFSKTTTAEFEEFLRLKGVAFTVDKNLRFDEQMYLRVTKTQVGSASLTVNYIAFNWPNKQREELPKGADKSNRSQA